MALSSQISRTTLLTTSRVWPTWLPDAFVETERQLFITSLLSSTSTSTHSPTTTSTSPPNDTRHHTPPPHQQTSFNFSNCLQSLFSFQDSILGKHNPFTPPQFPFQQARTFSQRATHASPWHRALYSPIPRSLIACSSEREFSTSSARAGMVDGEKQGLRVRAATVEEGRGRSLSRGAAGSGVVREGERERMLEKKERFSAMRKRIVDVL